MWRCKERTGGGGGRVIDEGEMSGMKGGNKKVVGEGGKGGEGRRSRRRRRKEQNGDGWVIKIRKKERRMVRRKEYRSGIWSERERRM